MLGLAWANLTHHKVRTLLSALAVGLGIIKYRPALPDPLRRGLIVHRGELTPDFNYIENHL